jgi:OFA family oxalate/formate antiporter-like MFS transporter
VNESQTFGSRWKRYVVLAAAVLVQVCLGGVYAWSEFAVSLRESYGMATVQTQTVFGVTFLTFTITMLLAGRLEARWGPRVSTCVGGLMTATGYLVASFSGGAFPLVLLGAGLLAGMGLGFAYLGPVVTCVKWFPGHKGLVAGISVGGFGGGAIVLAWLIETLLAAGYDVLAIFRIVGVTYGALIMAASWLLFTSAAPKGRDATKVLAVRALLKERRLWPLMAGMFAGTFAGLLVIGNLKSIGLTAGLDAKAASVTITWFAIGNVLGRIVWGRIHDRFGYPSLPAAMALLSGFTLLLAAGNAHAIVLYTGCFGVGFGYGSCFVLYAAHSASLFGVHAIATVYPWIFLSYGVSGLVGPVVGGSLYDATGSYGLAILLAAVVATGGLAVLLLLRSMPHPAHLHAEATGDGESGN